jgi:hypothetical protein
VFRSGRFLATAGICYGEEMILSGRGSRRGVAVVGAALLACQLLVGCGAPAATPSADAGPVPGTAQLVPQDGSEVGLAYGVARILRVLYLDENGTPRPGRAVAFAIVGEARGSTLSAPSAQTDATGIASVELRAGQNEAAFQVQVSATGATAAVFLVAINERGEFAVLVIRSTIPADVTVSGQLAVRLYDHENDGVTCATLPVFAPPTTPRTLFADPPDKAVTFGTLLPTRGYSVLVASSDAAPLVAGCVDLGPGLLETGITMETLVPLRLLVGELAASYVLTSQLPIGTLDEVADAFAPLTCPLAPADLIVDCLIDAQTGAEGDPLDCVPSAADLADPTGLALAAHRGALLADGCHDENIVAGVPSRSLEKVLRDALVSAAPSVIDSLDAAALPETVASALARLTLTSQLRLTATPAPGHWVAEHRLTGATFTDASGAGEAVLDLATTGLPHPTALGVGVTELATGEVELAPHEMSLRFGHLARQAAGILLFARHGLPADSPAIFDLLGQALAAGKPDLCDALDELICPAAGLAAGCLQATCAEAWAACPTALDARLLAFDGGTDISLEGTALPAWTTDPVADFLDDGQWAAALGPAARRVSLNATFTGAPQPAARHQTMRRELDPGER